MKCGYCGYEIARPNVKICPLCGNYVTQKGADEELDSKNLPEADNPEKRDLIEDPILTDNESFLGNSNNIEDTKSSYVEVGDTPDLINEKINNQPVETTGNLQAEEYVQQNNRNLTPEDSDEYLENGTYQPYSYEEEDEEKGQQDIPAERKELTLVMSLLAVIIGLLMGMIAYNVLV